MFSCGPTKFAFLFLLLSTSMAEASNFDCKLVESDQAGHQHVYSELASQKGLDPIEMAYCDHERYPRWIARWAPFAERSIDGAVWHRFATASCFDRTGDLNCRITDHVFTQDSHVVIDIPECDVSMETIAAIYNAIARDYPGHEMKEIEFITVTDGGAWSPEHYGYSVKVNEPPEFAGGMIMKMVHTCEDNGCQWRAAHSEGSWMGGQLALPALRRERGDPLIQVLVP